MFEIIHIGLKWIKPLIITTILAGVIAAAFSMLMPNYYESKVVFQPINPAMLDRSMFSSEGKPIYMFGSKADIDRVITLAKSNSMLSWVYKTFDLMKHYEIDPAGKEAGYKLNKKFMSNFSIMKNSQGAVDLTVLDVNPILARDIANNMVLQIDSLNREMIVGKKRDKVAILKTEVNNKQKIVDNMSAELTSLIRTNPQDTVSANVLRRRLMANMSDLQTATTSYDQSNAIASQNLSTLYYFEMAKASDRKAKPVRSILVLGAMAFTFILLFALAVFIEKFKEYQNSLS